MYLSKFPNLIASARFHPIIHANKLRSEVKNKLVITENLTIMHKAHLHIVDLTVELSRYRIDIYIVALGSRQQVENEVRPSPRSQVNSFRRVIL